jgi:hypothetical protein
MKPLEGTVMATLTVFGETVKDILDAYLRNPT